ncbi:lipase family alpha/beta hydrolase [Nocardia acidivorans]|uniref:lipase family alpha/beta hydrolase n=1 Tax=Nocardia acidivorans TaxID=404580 RepID=UPI000A506252|nr:alpha/beta fold hydrolase [Nocardia acidivorans]
MGIRRSRTRKALLHSVVPVGVLVIGVIAAMTALPVESGVATAGPAGQPVAGTIVYLPAVVPVEAGPPQDGPLAAANYLKSHPNAAPAGTNDFGCKPRAEHPRPVVLAHGTDSSAYSDFSVIGPQLVQAGFCVFALNYGGKPGGKSYGTEDVWASSAQVGGFVDQVLAATGATKVDMVGFSQGASVTRYYINKLGGAAKVGQWLGVASPSYGGVMYGLVPVADKVPALYSVAELFSSVAAVQQAAGSPFMTELNAGGDTVPGVRYTTIGSRVDEMIQPFDNIALRGAGATNLVLQDLCPENKTGHFHEVYDPYVQQLVRNVIDPAHAVAPTCVPVALGTGISEVVLAAHS